MINNHPAHHPFSTFQDKKSLPGQKALLAKFATNRKETGIESAVINRINICNNSTELKLYSERYDENRLWRIIKESTDLNSKIAQAAANAISVLNYKGIPFSGKDLSGIQVPGANLSQGYFHNTNFTCADLQNVNFQQAYLADAVFAHARMKGINFGISYLKIPGSQSFSNSNVLAKHDNIVAVGEKSSQFRSDSSVKIHLWSLPSQTYLFSCAPKGSVADLEFTADGKILVSCGGPYIKAWNTETGALLHTFTPNYVLIREIEDELSEFLFQGLKECQCVTEVAGYSDYVAVCSDWKEMGKVLADLNSDLSKRFLSFFNNKLRIQGVSVSPHSNKPILACSNGQGDLYLWDLKEGLLLCFLPHFEERAVGPPLFKVDDPQHLFLPTDNSIQLVNSETGAVICKWKGLFSKKEDKLIYDPTNKRLAARGMEGAFISIWSTEGEREVIATGMASNLISFDPDDDYFKSIFHLGTQATAIAFSEDGKMLAVASKLEIRIFVFDCEVLKLQSIWRDEELALGGIACIDDIQFIQKDQFLLTLCKGTKPKIWNFKTGEIVSSETLLNYKVEYVAQTQDNTRVFILSAEILKMLNTQTGNVVFVADLKYCKRFALSNDSRHLLIEKKYSLQLWSLETMSYIKTISEHEDKEVLGIAFLSNERIFILKKDIAHIYDTVSQNTIEILKGKLSNISAHHFSSDGRWLVVGTNDGFLQAWDSISGKFYQTHGLNSYSVTSIRCEYEQTAEGLQDLIVISRSWHEIAGGALQPETIFWNPIKDNTKTFQTNDVYIIPGDPLHLLLKKGIYMHLVTRTAGEHLNRLIHKFRVDSPSEFSHPGILINSSIRFVDPSIKLPALENDNQIRLIDDYGRFKVWLKHSEEIRPLDLEYSTHNSFTIMHPTRPLLFAGKECGMIQIWDPFNGFLLDILWAHSKIITFLTFSDNGNCLLSGSSEGVVAKWKLANHEQPKTLLQWRTKPNSLVLHEVNIHEADLDTAGQSLLFNNDLESNLLEIKKLLTEESYIQRPYLFSSDDEKDEFFSDTQVKSLNLDESIMILHHSIFKENDDRLFLEAFLNRFQTIKHCTPTSFHFILDAMELVAKQLRDQTPIDPIPVSVLQRVLESPMPKTLKLVRDLLDVTLRKVIFRMCSKLSVISDIRPLA